MNLGLLAGLAGLTMLLPTGAPAAADGDIAWQHRVRQDAVTLTANPLGTASRTAFYIGRGFTEAAIQPYALACGFSFGMQNGGRHALATRLADWYAVGADNRRIKLRLPESWSAEWAKAGVPPAARIAFKWAQFQADNTFEPGDWIMGMATLETAPVAPFRIVARYQVAGNHKENHEIVLDKLACAND
ncbi:MAG: hypothetical protein KJ787_03915 [Gammaproteobacteria bacterium]|nr:hypothetical protein [Gammaproteobacteria bacterium]MBU1645459.1 hypothetical protein [Gammaproteobacteria bacterium]MBU1971082.1 hypothetical protein [Gammaproteobacteria bacterium]